MQLARFSQAPTLRCHAHWLNLSNIHHSGNRAAASHSRQTGIEECFDDVDLADLAANLIKRSKERRGYGVIPAS
jgi:hypothetical protein